MPASINPLLAPPAAFEIAGTPIASPPFIVSSIAAPSPVDSSAPLQSQTAIDDAKLVELARQQIAEERKKEETENDAKLVEMARQQIIDEQKKEQTMKSAESILDQVRQLSLAHIPDPVNPGGD